jgi:hypothetical protein
MDYSINKKWYKKWWAIILFIFLFLVILLFLLVFLYIIREVKNYQDPNLNNVNNLENQIVYYINNPFVFLKQYFKINFVIFILIIFS